MTAKIKRWKILYQRSIPPVWPEQGRLHRHVRAAEDVRDGRGLRRVQQGGDRGLHGRGGQGKRALWHMMYDVWTTQITSNLQDGNGKLDYEEFIKMLKQYDWIEATSSLLSFLESVVFPQNILYSNVNLFANTSQSKTFRISISISKCNKLTTWRPDTWWRCCTWAPPECWRRPRAWAGCSWGRDSRWACWAWGGPAPRRCSPAPAGWRRGSHPWSACPGRSPGWRE